MPNLPEHLVPEEFAGNEWFVEEQYERYQKDKNLVDPSWWPIFETIDKALGGAGTASAAPAAAPAPKGAAGEGTPVAAPLPGVVTKVLVAAGQAVKKGDTVVVLEAMKMENNITAECDGKITGICVAAGDSVLEGTTLVTIG